MSAQATLKTETLPPRFLAYLIETGKDFRQVEYSDYAAWTLGRYEQWTAAGRPGTFTHFCFGLARDADPHQANSKPRTSFQAPQAAAVPATQPRELLHIACTQAVRRVPAAPSRFPSVSEALS